MSLKGCSSLRNGVRTNGVCNSYAYRHFGGDGEPKLMQYLLWQVHTKSSWVRSLWFVFVIALVFGMVGCSDAEYSRTGQCRLRLHAHGHPANTSDGL